ncbi:flippase [Shewanella sp. VB17]|uniref:flippase n=1 Tax=Shewanella sp. VB17 TaxID=2739432 RepID=UPI0015679844|nr:flippase [Shewanella sp. VB17]NRD74682.1 flippase [Shewanella sp. VB17]
MILSPFFNPILANISWLLTDRVITMLIQLLVSVVLACSLGPVGFGELSYLLAFIAMVMPLASLGLNAIVTRELINAPNSEHKIIATVMCFRLMGAFIGSVICLCFVYGGGVTLQVHQGLALLALANVFNAFAVVEFWFQAQLQAKPVVRMRLLIAMFFAFAKLLAVWCQASFMVLVSLFALETVCLGGGYIVIYYYYSASVYWRECDFSYGVGLLKQSFWLVLSGIAAVIYLKVDQLMLQHLTSSEQVGTYAVAAKLSEVWYFFADAIVISLFPAMIKLSKKLDTGRYWYRLQSVSDGLFVMAAGIAIVVSLLAKPLIILLFGVDYLPSVTILQIHIWAGVFVFMRALVSKWLLVANLLPFSLLSHGIGAIINVGVNWLLIPIWGGQGAAVATLLSYFIASYLAFWISPKTRPIAKVMSYSILLPFTFGYRYWPRHSLENKS